MRTVEERGRKEGMAKIERKNERKKENRVSIRLEEGEVVEEVERKES
jgi:hypothetical protein